jgi:NAD(P)-dependent dehydrogenase (short-subunit alcohol dehydrogenase family)
MSSTTSPMHGKTVLITGASNGIGLATAQALAAAGADLVLLCRDTHRGASAHDEIARRSNSGCVPDLVLADLESQKQIRHVAEDVQSRYDRLDVLVNNAGNVFARRELTEDGIERTFALNHLAPFLLTNLLLDLVKAAPQGRIVNVTSEIHAGKLDWNNLQSEKHHQFFKAYQATKTESILFTNELARRLAGTAVTVNAVSPGPSRTGFGQDLTGAWALFPKVMKAMPMFHSAEKGSRVVVHAAAEPALATVTGQFFMNSKPRKSKPITDSPEAAARLWRLSEQLMHLSATTGRSLTQRPVHKQAVGVIGDRPSTRLA